MYDPLTQVILSIIIFLVSIPVQWCLNLVFENYIFPPTKVRAEYKANCEGISEADSSNTSSSSRLVRVKETVRRFRDAAQASILLSQTASSSSSSASKEMSSVGDESNVHLRGDELVSQLQTLPPDAQGAQLMRQFFMDLLGGSQEKEAKIMGSSYERATAQETFLVDWAVKWMAFVFVVLLNAFFCMVCVLYALSKEPR
jgi:hypothetical protein